MPGYIAFHVLEKYLRNNAHKSTDEVLFELKEMRDISENVNSTKRELAKISEEFVKRKRELEKKLHEHMDECKHPVTEVNSTAYSQSLFCLICDKELNS